MQSLKPSPRPARQSARPPWPMRLAFGLLLLLSAATLGACATSLPSVSVAPQKPLEIPPPPVTKSPPPSGTYWQKHCDFRQSLQAQLKVTLPKSEHCKTGGPSDDASLQRAEAQGQAPQAATTE